MTPDDSDLEGFEDDEEQASFVRTRRKARRDRFLAELADSMDRQGGFTTTYKPGRHEEGWLLSSLQIFYEQNLISDVLGQIKGDKEASVYRCQAHPTTGMDLLAAKVYRPRPFRNLRNDKMYREGRPTITAEGRPVKTTDHRVLRALGKKTAFGEQVRHTSWLMYEYTTLERLYRAGAAVPQPVAAADNAILMSYQGDAYRAAPTLSEVSLDPEEAEALFTEVLQGIECMLRHDLIHGDLSAYNILYWNGKATLIDFPQVTSPHASLNARFLLGRDITRVCDYFGRQGVRCDADALLRDLWSRCVEADREPVPANEGS